MQGTDLKSIVNRIVDLPTLPQVVTSLINAIQDPYSDARIINNIMVNDPSLAARILKLVNSSFYSLPNKVISIQQAVVILGFVTVRSLAISASVFDLFGSDSFSHEGYWKQSLACALMTEKLSNHSERIQSESCFTIGLLHGIGKIIIEQYAPVKFDEIICEGKEKELSFIEAEKIVLNTSYTEIGFWLSEKWKLPEIVQQAILNQNNIEECPEDAKPYAAAVQLARRYARICECENGSDFDAPGELPDELWEILEIDEDKQEAAIEELKEQVAVAEEMLSQLGC